MIRRVAYLTAIVAFVLVGIACGDDGGGGKAFEDFLPELPAPTGGAQSVWAGQITADSSGELIDGPAASGMVGDYYIRNAKGRFIIQAATRVIGVVPQGGNLVDAIPLDANGDPAAEDHFGELSLVYLVGRTCRHETIEVLQDGSGGGAAVIRATGVSANNDFINLRGIGLLSIPPEINPDFDDEIQCATTYVLDPDSNTLHVSWTLFNAGDELIHGPFGTLNDTGGQVASWGRGLGFERLGIDSLVSATDPAPIEYAVYQAPGVAYGLMPRHTDPTITNSTFLIQGVSIILYGAEKLLDILNEKYWFLNLVGGDGVTYAMDISVGFDGADVEEAFWTGGAQPAEVASIAGTVSWSGGGTPMGARVGLYRDVNSDGAIDEDDQIMTYFIAEDDGSFSGRVPPGAYLLRGEVLDQARSETQSITLAAAGLADLTVSLPKPVKFDYEISKFDGGNFIPAKITVIGRNPADPDKRIFDRFDRMTGVVRMVHSLRGSTSAGAMTDEPFYLPPGTYRVIATRGTEWSVDSQTITVTAGQADQNLSFRLRRVIDTPNYIASEYHVHQVGSPDSPVLNPERVASAVGDGVELFCTSDHDYVTDLQPYVESMSLTDYVRVMPGIETTPFSYGHFNAWPMAPLMDSPNRGAIDWAAGTDGFAMIPGEIFSAMRARGATMVQVNHPRATAGSIADFMQFFDRAGLSYDFDTRSVDGDIVRAPVPNQWLRLPEISLWDDSFNALEVWNGFSISDSNDDGVREISSADIVLRDFFNFTSLGMQITPLGNSDTHTSVKAPMGMPRTYVRVTDDSSNSLTTGNIVDDALDTLAARNGTPRDVVITNGPFMTVKADGQGNSAIGRVIDGTDGSVTLEIEIWSPAWAPFDTVELFANETVEVGKAARPSALQPRYCFTSRTGLTATDTCALAEGGEQALTVDLDDLGDGYSRYHSTVSITLSAAEVTAMNRAGSVSGDAWVMVRVYGSRGIFPILLAGVVNDGNVDILASGTQAEVDAALDGVGVPAMAFTAPIYIDFDGNGYKAAFQP